MKRAYPKYLREILTITVITFIYFALLEKNGLLLFKIIKADFINPPPPYLLIISVLEYFILKKIFYSNKYIGAFTGFFLNCTLYYTLEKFVRILLNEPVLLSIVLHAGLFTSLQIIVILLFKQDKH